MGDKSVKCSPRAVGHARRGQLALLSLMRMRLSRMLSANDGTIILLESGCTRAGCRCCYRIQSPAYWNSSHRCNEHAARPDRATIATTISVFTWRLGFAP
eukprot:4152831-Pleurochrysis_carterae.AAC.2